MNHKGRYSWKPQGHERRQGARGKPMKNRQGGDGGKAAVVLVLWRRESLQRQGSFSGERKWPPHAAPWETADLSLKIVAAHEEV